MAAGDSRPKATGTKNTRPPATWKANHASAKRLGPTSACSMAPKNHSMSTLPTMCMGSRTPCKKP